MDKKRQQIIDNNEISELCTFQLGGYPQKVLIEGKYRHLPVIISLHGGPGTPIPFSVGCRGLFPEFTDNAIMVYWDQLGCGINDRVIDDSFTIDHFVTMTEDLIRAVKAKFPENKIHLFATSWGSVLSALVLERTKGLVDGVVAYGQIVKNLFFCEEVFAELEKTKIPPKKLEAIKNVDTNHITGKNLALVSSCIRKYTAGYTNKAGEAAPMGSIIKGLLTSPDYSFRDFKAIMVNGYRKNLSLWQELLKLDLTDVLRATQVPYVMVQGDTDIVASTKNARELVGENALLRCTVIKNAGHMPSKAAMDAVVGELVTQTSISR